MKRARRIGKGKRERVRRRRRIKKHARYCDRLQRQALVALKHLDRPAFRFQPQDCWYIDPLS